MRALISSLGLGKIESKRAFVARPANLADWMIGMLGFAVALVLGGETYSHIEIKHKYDWINQVNPIFVWFAYLDLIHAMTIAVLIPATMTYLAIRLRGRRPPTPRLSRHQGFVAATVATATIMMGLLLNLAKLMMGFPSHRMNVHWVMTFYPSVDYVVLGSWLSLMFTGRWHRDRLWFEIPGIILGAAWIATSLIEWFGLALHLELYRY